MGAGLWWLPTCQVDWKTSATDLPCLPLQLPQGAQAVLSQTYAVARHHWPGVARIPLLPSFSLLIIPAIPTAWTLGWFRGLKET